MTEKPLGDKPLASEEPEEPPAPPPRPPRDIGREDADSTAAIPLFPPGPDGS